MSSDGYQDKLDEQLDRMNEQLRDKGNAPARDLWPDIDRTISAAEQHQVRPPVRYRWGRWQIAATVAAGIALAAVGWWGQGHERTADKVLVPASQDKSLVTEDSELDLINLALAELNTALAEDPENRSLANLGLMLHQSRGRVMRQSTGLQLN